MTERLAVGLLAAAIAVLFAGQQLIAGFPREPHVATPVAATYARQARFVAKALAGSTTLPPSPSMDSDLSLVQGADVFVFFLESYGAVTYERPEFAQPLASNRADLEKTIRDANKQVVSAYVESPTFGGSSWFAHLSLLSGVEVRDPDTNALLMTSKRETLVTEFARHGYRTVALMPGLYQSWPEGAFYGFDEIYDARRLDYHGPQFGWFAIPDQFALARLDALEVNRAPRAPLFVFFPTISTHTPFTPAPPYQRDWSRILTPQPYEANDVERAFEQTPDWMNLGPSYVEAVKYAYLVLDGYLHQPRDRDFIMILLGDHQPPALVSGEGAPWDVPVHVIASRPAVLDRLLSQGFRNGLTPERPAVGHMNGLGPMLLKAFGTVGKPA